MIIIVYINYANLKKARKFKGVTQKELAKKVLDVTQKTYNLKETGNRDFFLMEAKKMADYYNVTIDQLFFSQDVTEWLKED